MPNCFKGLIQFSITHTLISSRLGCPLSNCNRYSMDYQKKIDLLLGEANLAAVPEAEWTPLSGDGSDRKFFRGGVVWLCFLQQQFLNPKR